MRFRGLSRLSALLASASAIAGAACLMAAPAGATPRQDAGARMVVEAKEMVYDEKRNTVTAQGQVQIPLARRISGHRLLLNVESSSSPAGLPHGGRFRLKERWVWLWHPHFWLTLLLVALVIFLAIMLAG